MDSAEIEKLYLESDYFWQTACNDNNDNHTVTGSSEIDTCLQYHLNRILKCLEVCLLFLIFHIFSENNGI